MHRLVFRAVARREIAEIAAYIGHESGSRDVAEAFIEKLIAHCEKISCLPSVMGRPRPEFGSDYRSIVYREYVIFLRYADEDGGRVLYIVHIVHRARDLARFFEASRDVGDLP